MKKLSTILLIFILTTGFFGRAQAVFISHEIDGECVSQQEYLSYLNKFEQSRYKKYSASDKAYTATLNSTHDIAYYEEEEQEECQAKKEKSLAKIIFTNCFQAVAAFELICIATTLIVRGLCSN